MVQKVFIINARELCGVSACFCLLLKVTYRGVSTDWDMRCHRSTLKYEHAKSAVDTGFTKGFIYRKKRNYLFLSI